MVGGILFPFQSCEISITLSINSLRNYWAFDDSPYLLYHIHLDTIMPIQKYEVSLTAEERKQLTKIMKSGKMPARTFLRANVLLAIDRNGNSL